MICKMLLQIAVNTVINLTMHQTNIPRCTILQKKYAHVRYGIWCIVGFVSEVHSFPYTHKRHPRLAQVSYDVFLWVEGMTCVRWLLLLIWMIYHAIINSLWPSDAICRQGSWSTLVHVMASCLMPPSHYLNQCWFIITKVQWCSSEGNFAWDIRAISC